MARPLDQQIRDCDPGPPTSRGEIEAFMAGVEFACVNLVAAARSISLDVRGSVQSQSNDGKEQRSVSGAIVRSGDPAFARKLIGVAEMLYNAGKDHARKLYPDFAPVKFYSELPKAAKQQDD